MPCFFFLYNAQKAVLLLVSGWVSCYVEAVVCDSSDNLVAQIQVCILFYVHGLK